MADVMIKFIGGVEHVWKNSEYKIDKIGVTIYDKGKECVIPHTSILYVLINPTVQEGFQNGSTTDAKGLGN